MRLKIIYLFRKILDLCINLKKRQNEKETQKETGKERERTETEKGIGKEHER